MKQLFPMLSPWRRGALIACLVLALMAYVLKFCLPGYGFSALVCVGLIGLLLFYTLFPLLGGRFPLLTKWGLRVVTGLLVLGLLVAGVTEALIIRASFGTRQDRAEYVVVLGAKVRETGPSASLWDRIYGARNYLNAYPQAIAILSGGQGDDEPMTEARAMYEELVKLGISPDRLRLEEKATSTWENLTFALDIIQAETGGRPQRLGVITSEYHLFRASLFARACQVEFVGIPARTSRASQMINHFLREVAGVWHYLLLGGQYE